MYEAASSRCSAGGPLGNLQRCPHYTAEHWVLCSREKSQPARKKDAKQLPNRGLKRYLLPHTCQNTNMHICRWLVSGRWRSHQGTRSTSRSCGGSRRLESWVPLGTSPEDLGFSMRFFQAGCETSMIEALPSIFLAFLVGLHSWTTTEYHFLKETWKLGKGPLKD